MAVAAVMLVLVGIYSVSLVFSNEKVETGFASQTTVTLPDGTLVTLNAGSKLAWNDRRFMKNRKVNVSGEAFFDVQKGSRFTIETSNGNVTILGTQLNVFSREKEFRVSCITGKVGVSSGNFEVVLTPGEEADLTSSGLQKTTSEYIEQSAAWTEGIFYFEDQPLVSIFAEIERQFNVTIKYQGDPNRLITVSFSNRKLEETLDVVCIPMGLKYEVDKNNIISITENSK
jgi:ferric-dicitrate binding protein FerR (iron transport regulator)